MKERNQQGDEEEKAKKQFGMAGEELNLGSYVVSEKLKKGGGGLIFKGIGHTSLNGKKKKKTLSKCQNLLVLKKNKQTR